MKHGVKLISRRKIDDYVPQAPLCIRCHTEIEVTTAHWGRIVPQGSFGTAREEGRKFRLHNGTVHTIETVKELAFPIKITGWVCSPCHTELWNTTWYDKNQHLRRGFETVHREVIQPKGDDYEASPILKGLYAPHIGKQRGRKRVDYHENATADHKSVVIDDSRLPHSPLDDRKLKGFDKPKRDDIKIDGTKRKTIVKGGRWKVNPQEYNYKPQETIDKPRLSTKKVDRLSDADKAALQRIEQRMSEYVSPFDKPDNE